MEGVDISPVGHRAVALTEPRPGLAVRRSGRRIPGSAKFYSDGLHLKMGRRRRRPARRQGFDLPRVGSGANPREALIPDPRNDENLAVAQTHLAFIRFHNRVVDTLPAAMPPAQQLQRGAEDRHQALPVDDPHRLPAEDLRARGRHGRVHQRAQGVRGRRRRRTACRRCRSSSRSRPSGSDTA